MNSNSLIKKVLVLVFLLVILIAVFALQGGDFGEGYFSWLKMRLIGMGPELNLAEEDSGLDFATLKPLAKAGNDEVEKDNTATIKDVESADAKGFGVAKEDVKVVKVIPETSGPSIAEVLLEIEIEINQIAEEIERIDHEIKSLLEITT